MNEIEQSWIQDIINFASLEASMENYRMILEEVLSISICSLVYQASGESS